MTRTGGVRETAQTARAGLVGLACMAGLLALALLGGVAALVGFHFPAATKPLQPAIRPPPPRLEPVPGLDRVAGARRGAARLSGYGWADRGQGLARIPIERAMELRAAEGWADRDAPP